MKILVTAGGQGTKMWPYSRSDKPKQFQTIIGDETTYEHNIKILLTKFAPEDIYISTKRKFIKYISEQSPQIPLKNYIVEPDIAKDRGPAEGLAFLRLSLCCPDEPFFVVQADCYRDSAKDFIAMIEQADKLVQKHGQLITGGIKATEASIGVDYLKLGKHLGNEAYIIDEFIFRKDSIRETRDLIQNYHVVTHSNHMCWYPDKILAAYKKYRPDWHEKLMQIKEHIDQPGENDAVEKIYAEMEKGPTEEVTEHIMNSGEAMVILLPYKWTDLGTWTSVYDFFADGVENYEDGDVVSFDSRGSLVKSSRKDKMVAVAGLDNVVVVDTEDVLLVVDKDKIEQLKNIQDIIKEQESSQYL